MAFVRVSHDQRFNIDFAVQFRYEIFENFGNEIDRLEIIQKVKELIEYVREFIENKGIMQDGQLPKKTE
ncbi:MAG: hypothetical protein V1872_12450 [bacterium]